MIELPLLVLASAALALGLDWLHVPMPWMLGPMLVGVGTVALRGEPRHVHAGFSGVGQAVLGLAAGVSFPLVSLRVAGAHMLPLVVAVLLTGALSLAGGYLMSRMAGLDRATGFLGTLPGAAHAMVAMSGDMGVDPVAVAVLQYLRLLMVVAFTPLAVGILFPHGSTGPAASAAVAGLPVAPWLVNALFLVACGLVGAFGGRWVKMPSATFLGPFVVALPLSWMLPVQFNLPPWAVNAGTLLLGLSIGARFDLPGARKLGRAAVIQAGMVVALIAVGLLAGYVFHLTTGVDTTTAVLGSAPGGMDVMVATAQQLHGDPGLVVAMQMTRWLLVLLAGPWVASRLARPRLRVPAHHL